MTWFRWIMRHNQGKKNHILATCLPWKVIFLEFICFCCFICHALCAALRLACWNALFAQNNLWWFISTSNVAAQWRDNQLYSQTTKECSFCSVRRIFERGGLENLIIMKTERNISPLRISPFFCPKLGEDRKKIRSSLKISPVFGPKLGQDQTNRSLPTFCLIEWSDSLPKIQRGAMPQFCILFYTNYTILATQMGGHGTMPPLNTPLVPFNENETFGQIFLAQNLSCNPEARKL